MGGSDLAVECAYGARGGMESAAVCEVDLQLCASRAARLHAHALSHPHPRASSFAFLLGAGGEQLNGHIHT